MRDITMYSKLTGGAIASDDDRCHGFLLGSTIHHLEI
jgi:hypothetical protein